MSKSDLQAPKPPEWSVEEVPTETRMMVKQPNGEFLEFPEAIAEIHNKLDKILKALQG